MAVFYGSSNVYRNFERALAAGVFSGRSFQLVKCTKKAVFDSHLATLKTASLVVTSVLENFITEVCGGVPDLEIQLFAHQQLTAHVESLNELVNRLPDATAVICPPIFRSTPPWFGPYLLDFHSFLVAEVNRIGSTRIGVSTPFIVLPSYLESDGVHLSSAGGDLFLAHIDAQLRAMLVEVDPSARPEPTAAEANPPCNTGSVPTTTLDSLEVTVSALSRSTAEFEFLARRRFQDDNLIFARFKEESDAEVNRSREDRVVITGLGSPPLIVTSHAEKKKYYIDLVNRLTTLACASVDPLPSVVDVYINLRKDKGTPLVEARFTTPAGAQHFRREGVRLAKEEHSEFTSLFLANCVTQSTRVRIEILKAIAKKLTTVTECAFVQGFISRPLLQYHVQDGARSTADGVGRGYYFVDAVAKFGGKLEDQDLSTAYLRAGKTFIGAMSQYFVVLNDKQASRGVRSAANRVPIGRRGGRTAPPRGPPRLQSGARSSPILDIPVDVRGTKRAAEPNEEPSKRKENDSVSVAE